MSLTPRQAALVAVQVSLDRDLGTHDPELIVQLEEPVMESPLPWAIPEQRRPRRDQGVRA